MHRGDKRAFVTGVSLALLGTAALGAESFTVFTPGTPIRAGEVNANFSTLRSGLEGKQAKVTGSPCQAGQFVRGIGEGGAVECGVDQVGTPGGAGVASLNGKTGSLALEAGPNITIDSSQSGKLIVSGTGGGGKLPLPFSGSVNSPNPAFSVTNSGAGTALLASSPNAGGDGVSGISLGGAGVRAYSESGYGVSAVSGGGVAGVYGEGKVSGGAGVRGVNSGGPGSSGVWGESAAGSGVRGSSASGTGVQGTSEKGYGVKGTVSVSGTGVYGENTSNAAGAGIQGRADAVNSVGVGGTSTAGTGVSGTSATGTGVRGTTAAPSDVNSVGVEGVNSGQYGYGVRGEHKGSGFGVYGTSRATGVGGESPTGIGVLGRGPTAIRAEGNAVQSLGFGGFLKAAVIVDVTKPAGGQIVRCYNSQLTGAAATTAPCGFSIESARGQWRVVFGFDTRNTFASATLTDDEGTCFAPSCPFPALSGVVYEQDSVVVVTRRTEDDYYANPDKGFTLLLF